MRSVWPMRRNAHRSPSSQEGRWPTASWASPSLLLVDLGRLRNHSHEQRHLMRSPSDSGLAHPSSFYRPVHRLPRHLPYVLACVGACLHGEGGARGLLLMTVGVRRDLPSPQGREGEQRRLSPTRVSGASYSGGSEEK